MQCDPLGQRLTLVLFSAAFLPQERRGCAADSAGQEGFWPAVPVCGGCAQRHVARCACRGAASQQAWRQLRHRLDCSAAWALLAARCSLRAPPASFPAAGTQEAIHSALACLWALTCSSPELYEPGCGAAYFPTSLLHNQQAWREPVSHPLVKAVRGRGRAAGGGAAIYGGMGQRSSSCCVLARSQTCFDAREAGSPAGLPAASAV